jgi:hypothetical protein
MGEAAITDDWRYIVVDGRRWKARISDVDFPAIPPRDSVASPPYDDPDHQRGDHCHRRDRHRPPRVIGSGVPQ